MAIAPVQQTSQVLFSDVTSATASFGSTPGASSVVFVTTTFYPNPPASCTCTVGGVSASLILDVPGPATTTRLWCAVGPFADGDVVLSAGDVLYGAMHAAEFSGVGGLLSTSSGTPPTWDYPDPGVDGALAITIATDGSSDGAGHWVAPSGYTPLLDYADWNAASSGAGAYRILGAAAAGSATWGTSGIQTLSGAVYAPAAGGGDLTADVGRSDETDTAFGPGRAKRRSAGLSPTTDTALAVSRSKRRVAGQTTETDTASALARSKRRAASVSTETGTAVALTRSKRKSVSVSTESETAFAVARTKRRTIGVSIEVETALALTKSKRRPASAGLEADSALALSGPSEGVGLSLESDTAFKLNAAKRRLVGLAVESSSAFALAKSKRRPAATSAEITSALALGRTKSTRVDLAEVSIAGDVAPTAPDVGNGQTITVTPSGEIICAWRQKLNDADDASFRAFGAVFDRKTNKWGAAVRLDPSAGRRVGNFESSSNDKIAAFVWLDTVDFEVHAVVYDVQAGTWGAEVIVDSGAAGGQSVAVHDNRAVASYSAREKSETAAETRRRVAWFNGTSWSAPAIIPSPSGATGRVSTTTFGMSPANASGEFAVVYSQREVDALTTQLLVCFTGSLVTMTASAPELPYSGTTYQSGVNTASVAMADNGAVHVANTAIDPANAAARGLGLVSRVGGVWSTPDVRFDPSPLLFLRSQAIALAGQRPVVVVERGNSTATDNVSALATIGSESGVYGSLDLISTAPWTSSVRVTPSIIGTDYGRATASWWRGTDLYTASLNLASGWAAPANKGSTGLSSPPASTKALAGSRVHGDQALAWMASTVSGEFRLIANISLCRNAVETSAVLGLTKRKARSAGLSVEIASALALARRKARAPALAVEIDEAFNPLMFNPIVPKDLTAVATERFLVATASSPSVQASASSSDVRAEASSG